MWPTRSLPATYLGWIRFLSQTAPPQHDPKSLTRKDIVAYHARTDCLFRSGFVLCRSDQLGPPRRALETLIHERFERVEIGPFALLIAPRTPRQQICVNGTTLIVLGDVYDNDGGPVDGVLARLGAGDLLAAAATSDLGGRHAVIAIKGEDFTAFSDPMGSRSLVHTTQSTPAIASHAALLAEMLDIPQDREMAAFVAHPQYKKRIVGYLPGALTTYRGIRKVPPNHAFNARFNALARFWPHAPRKTTTPDEMFQVFDRALTALHDYMAPRYRSIIAATGGVDTRAVLSAFHRRGSPVTTMTWTDLNFHASERAVIDQIIAISGYPHHNLRVSYQTSGVTLLEKCGGLNAGSILGHSRRTRLMQILLNRLDKTPDITAGTTPEAASPARPWAFIIGYGGEIVRGFYRLKSRDPAHRFMPQDMLDLYNVRARGVPPDRAYSGTAMRAFREFYVAARYDRASLKGFDPNDIFYWEHRMGMWAASTLDSIDVALPVITGINSRRLFETALSLPDDQRLSKEIIARYIASRSPDLGRIPIV